MSCSISPRDIRDYLEGFCLDSTDVVTFTVSFADAATQIQLPSSADALKPNMSVSGDGIATGTKIESIDYQTNAITIDTPATGPQTDVVITITYNTALSDDWLIKRRDNYIIPWIKKRTIATFGGAREVTEYISGNGLTTMILSNRPIVDLSTLQYVDAAQESDGSLAQSVEIDKEQGILISRHRVYDAASHTVFRRGHKNIKVTYTYGYADLQTEAPDICEAISAWVAREALVLIGNRTGGGDISRPGFTRTFGDRGKYTHMINELDMKIHGILSGYFDGIGAP
jgi:hypothetical protein